MENAKMIQRNSIMNIGRQFEIDILKAFCIILMIVCHVCDGMTTATANDDLLKHIIFYFGNTTSGLFIFCIGIGLSYTTHDSPVALAKRGIKLLWQNYLLNFFKDSIPLWILSGFDLSRLYGTEEFYSVFATEIFTFAGLVFLLTALLKKLKCKSWIYLTVSLVFQLVATILSGAFDDSSLAVRLLMGVFFYTGSPVISLYPLFPFFIYVVLGMLFGELLKRTANKRSFYLRFAVCGTAASVVSSVIYKLIGFDISDYVFTDLYHANILPAAIWYLSQAAIWVALSYPVSLIVKGKAQKTVEYLSRNITNIYVIQWFCLVYPIIAFLIITGTSFPPIAGLPLSALIFFLTILISKRWTAIIKKQRNAKQQEQMSADLIDRQT